MIMDKEKIRNKITEYEVRKMKMSRGEKKGIIAGRLIGILRSERMIAPGQTVKVKTKSYRVRCVDLFDNKRIIIVE